MIRYDAEEKHRIALMTAIRTGRLNAISLHTRLPADEFQPNSVVPVEELRRYVAQFGIKVIFESGTFNPKSRVIVADLASLLAANRADDNPQLWQAVGDDGLRRTIAMALHFRGWPADGFTGVIPEIAAMAKAGQIEVHGLDRDAFSTDVDAICSSPGAFWLTAP
ncbi:hypothetical protein [Burkholderia stagnalis]|uniref:Uncharacterized protein n=1 Tax=Burkholderia stagnalis TaxID=1503054 RepID=A0A119WAS2_9BURK|nr:hypothetical protein [Burkholderia stagnalis]KVZ15247.1 hypothetical protein WT35_11610 [Burkholderia stagnalis]KWA47188.1 hypothetical protein WT42_01515 [Burkholderia stagnalis]KWA56069.1 hypothetical protein WT43_22435 [Burkholderia stagnalis]KWA67918.1 hypothetical protein WT44_02120 [Burkholderia stagnalis]KWC93345.1 hypothetical protein WT45_26900 [Burkholderia stagnalis]